MTGFVTKSVESETVGERLKNVRLNKKSSLDQIAGEIGVRPDYLEALEEGRYDDLPADVYVKGFLKAYADYLDVPSEGLLKLYQKDRKLKKELVKLKKGYQPVKPVKSPRFVVTPKMMVVTGAALVILIIVGYFVYQVSAFAESPKVEVSSPSSDMTVRGDALRVAGAVDPNIEVKINGQIVYLGGDGRFEEEINLKPGLNEIVVVGKNRIGKETIIKRNVILGE